MFNPISHDEVEQVISKWSAIFFSLLVNLPTTLSAVPSEMAGISWGVTESDLIIQDSRLWKGLDSPEYPNEEKKNTRCPGLLAVLPLVVCATTCHGLATVW
jgi:hypothetical protein